MGIYRARLKADLLSPHGAALYIAHFFYSKLEKLSANWPKIDNKTRMDECKTRMEYEKCAIYRDAPCGLNSSG